MHSLGIVLSELAKWRRIYRRDPYKFQKRLAEFGEESLGGFMGPNLKYRDAVVYCLKYNSRVRDNGEFNGRSGE